MYDLCCMDQWVAGGIEPTAGHVRRRPSKGEMIKGWGPSAGKMGHDVEPRDVTFESASNWIENGWQL